MAKRLAVIAALVALAVGAIVVARASTSTTTVKVTSSTRPTGCCGESTLAPTSTTSTTVETTTTMPPASPPAAPPTPPAQTGTYRVQAGDTLSAIAAAHGNLDVDALCANNRLADCNLIYPGQVLTLDGTPAPVPAPATSPARSPAPPANPSPAATPSPAASGFGCGPAEAYLAAHAHPHFTVTCAPHSAGGHYGETYCADSACSSGWIHIACPDPTVYRNEASNSYALAGKPSGFYGGGEPGIDPYGQEPAGGYAACNGMA